MRSIPNRMLTINKHNLETLVPIDADFIPTVKAILHSAVEPLCLVNAATMLRSVNDQDTRYLIIGEDMQDIELQDPGPEGEFIVSTERPMAPNNLRMTTHELVSIPISINGQRLGYLLASARTALLSAKELAAGLEQLANELVCLVQRYQTRYRIKAFYGDHPYWMGGSEALRKVDQQIAKLANASLPIVIRGDKGTGKLLTARALHCHGATDYTPFIESSCEDWETATIGKILPELWAYAKGGTLFLRNIDKLEPEGVAILQEFWCAKSAADEQRSKALGVRLVVSLSSGVPVMTEGAETLAQWLEFNFLELHLPNLRERRADIRVLAQYYIHEHYLDMKFDFTEDAWQILEAYTWPKNVQQLRRMIQKLAIMVDRPWVTAPLLLQLFPSLDVVERPRIAQKVVSLQSAPKAVSPESSISPSSIEVQVSLELVFGGARDLKWEHPLLIKAVSYMIDHHSTNINLTDAAVSAEASAPYLADLLKQRLGLSFSQVLTKIRVEQAKAIFQKAPAKSIDQVCGEIGFSDREGFEKVFKRMVGLSPKVYRAQFFKPLTLIQQ